MHSLLHIKYLFVYLSDITIKKKMKRIYISGAITGSTQASAQFESAEMFLKSKGFDPINPMKLDHSKSEKWEDYMRVDIKSLMDADGIYMLRGHERSQGAQIEKHLCLSLKMPIFFEEYPWYLDTFNSKRN